MSFISPQNALEKLSLSEGMIVLDIGAGTGAYALLAAHLVGREGRVFALDVQRDLLSRLKAKAVKEGLENVETIWADSEISGGTKLREGSIDACILSNVLFQLEKKEVLAKEAARVLRKNGKLLLIDWKDSFGGLGPQAKDVFSRDQALKLFSRVGFDMMSEFEPGDHHYAFIFCKK